MQLIILKLVSYSKLSLGMFRWFKTYLEPFFTHFSVFNAASDSEDNDADVQSQNEDDRPMQGLGAGLGTSRSMSKGQSIFM